MLGLPNGNSFGKLPALACVMHTVRWVSNNVVYSRVLFHVFFSMPVYLALAFCKPDSRLWMNFALDSMSWHFIHVCICDSCVFVLAFQCTYVYIHLLISSQTITYSCVSHSLCSHNTEQIFAVNAVFQNATYDVCIVH